VTWLLLLRAALVARDATPAGIPKRALTKIMHSDAAAEAACKCPYLHMTSSGCARLVQHAYCQPPAHPVWLRSACLHGHHRLPNAPPFYVAAVGVCATPRPRACCRT
jgi:hypothetical protein